MPQLLRIEANKLSGCIKMQSSARKSRSGILIFRGRIIACVYRCKSNPDNVFGPQAYEKILAEISAMTDICSYALPDALVLAAASMFHGGTVNISHKDDPMSALDLCLHLMEKSQEPGSIAILDETSSPVCILYISRGKVIGVNALPAEIAVKGDSSLQKYFRRHPKSQVLANSRKFTHCVSAAALTFSSLGMGRPKPVACPKRSDFDDLSMLVPLNALRPVENSNEPRSDRFIPSRRNTAEKLNLNLDVNSPYLIDPGRARTAPVTTFR
jgi:hypothetical protein